MTTGEGDDLDPRDARSDPDDDDDKDKRGRGQEQRIGVGGGDDSVSRIQLAARWAESFAVDGEAMSSMLRRFRSAYEYLDAVIHGVEPAEIDSVAEQSHSPVPTPPAPQQQPQTWSNPEPAPSPWAAPRPPDPPQEPRPWG